MPGVSIRLATPADAPERTELAHRAKASWGYPPVWMAAWDADLTLSAEYLGEHRGFVATRDERILGVVVLEEYREHWSLEHVWIDPGRHGQGIGRRLVEHVLSTARRERAVRVRVLSDPHAESFYLHLGAVRVGSHPAPMPGAPLRTLPVMEFGAR